MTTWEWVATAAAVLLMASAAVVALALVAARRREAVWSAAPGPARSWDEHTATAMAVLEPDALDERLDYGVAAGAERWLRDLANLNRRKES